MNEKAKAVSRPAARSWGGSSGVMTKTMTRMGWGGLALALLVATPLSGQVLAKELAEEAMAREAASQALASEVMARAMARDLAGQAFSQEVAARAMARDLAGQAFSQEVAAQAMARDLAAQAVGAVQGVDVAPEPWLQQDPADSLYRSARDALNRREFERAADLFAQIRARYPRSGYAPDSYYFQAFALQRMGGQERERQALSLLDQQRELHPDAASASDADQLRARMTGDARQAQEPGAQDACDPDDQEMRATALRALISMNGERALPLLREILGARDVCSAPLRRQAVFLVARASGDEAVDVLLDLAQRNPDPDSEVREQAVFWLSRVKTDAAVSALETILNQSDDEGVQEQAVFALSRQGSPRAAELLRTYAERSDAPRHVREQAIFWLGKDTEHGGPAYVRELFGSLDDPNLKEQVVQAVARSGTAEDRAWLLARARDANESTSVRKNALFWLGRSGISLAEIRGLYDSMTERDLREQLIFVMSRMDEPEAVDALMEIAQSETDRELREQAVFWLGKSDDPRAADFLMRLIRGGGR